MSTDTIPILHRDTSTQCQINTLLAVSDLMMKFLCTEPAGNPQQGRLDGEPRIAAETTLIKACSRLDSILDEGPRWGFDYQLRLEELFTRQAESARAVTEDQKKTLDMILVKETAQKELAVESKTPHNLYRPSLFTMADGTWVAFLGDPGDLRSGILGQGDSPRAALQQFDLAFEGQLTETQKKTIQAYVSHEHDTVEQSRPNDANQSDQGGKNSPSSGGLAGAQL